MSLALAAIVSAIVGLALGAGLLFLINQITGKKVMKNAEAEADRVIQRANGKAAKIDREAKMKAKEFENRARRNVENEIRKQKQKLSQDENQLKEQEVNLEKDFKRKEEDLTLKSRQVIEKEERLKIAEERIKTIDQDSQRKLEELQQQLESASKLTAEEAKRELIRSLEEDTRREIGGQLEAIENNMRKEIDQKAKRVLAAAVARYASEVSTEKTVSSIALSGEEMKGKIIGREGRNIRALEAACGVDLIIDETPETVIISSFDPVRREVAKLTLERLMADGRVHPARIEEVVDKAKADILKAMKEDGERAALDLGVIGVHDEVLSLLGSLKFRHSHNYNLFKHSIEVAYTAGLLASEMGLDVKDAHRAGLLHAIGQGIDHTVEGSYSRVGADFARKHGEREHITQSIRCHSGEKEPVSVLDHVVQAAFTLVESRPGVKRQMIESYIKRLSDLESVANSFDGVQRTYAIQAGKEIRVLVDSGKITDDQSKMLSRDIARKIEKELNYPGQVRVTVVRETRVIEHAR